MKVPLGERTLDIRWHHINPLGTSCDIRENGETVAVGFSTRHPRDQFCRATGRKVSLTKALADSGLSRDERAQVWREYLFVPNFRQFSNFNF
jgi:hypothetical protein